MTVYSRPPNGSALSRPLYSNPIPHRLLSWVAGLDSGLWNYLSLPHWDQRRRMRIVECIPYMSWLVIKLGYETRLINNDNDRNAQYMYAFICKKNSLYSLLGNKPSLSLSSSNRKINPADCVDMDCDGLKKAILVDEDGSLLGQPATIVPQSEFEWDTNAARGLGDYRIPVAMLTTTSGNRIAVVSKAPHKGTATHSICQLI